MGNHGVGALKRTECSSRLDVSQAFGELSIDHAALFERVLLIGGRELREDGDTSGI